MTWQMQIEQFWLDSIYAYDVLLLNLKWKKKKNHNCVSIQRFILQWAVQLQLYLQFLWWIFKGTRFPLWPRTITRTKTLNHTLELCSGKTMIGGGSRVWCWRRNLIRKITAHTDDITKNTDGIGQWKKQYEKKRNPHKWMQEWSPGFVFHVS